MRSKIIRLVSMVVLICTCQYALADAVSRPLLQMVILSPGGADEAYLLELSGNRVLNTKFGRGLTMSHDGYSFLEKMSEKNAVISHSEWDELRKLILVVSQLGKINDPSVVTDDWQIKFKTGENDIKHISQQTSKISATSAATDTEDNEIITDKN